MDPNTIAAIVAAIAAVAAAAVAFAALVPARDAANAAKEQTQLQREATRQAAQPNVWADIQPDNQQGTMIQLVVGNSGASMAKNIRVLIEPPMPDDPHDIGMNAAVLRRLSDGILSLAPNRTIRWSLGPGYELLKNDDDQTVYEISVTAEGPYGRLNPVMVHVRPSDWREARDAPDGSLHHIRNEIKNLTKAVQKLGKAIEK